MHRVSKDVWEVKISHVGSPGHELGWTPDGKRFMIPMNAAAVVEWDAHRLVVSDDFADT